MTALYWMLASLGYLACGFLTIFLGEYFLADVRLDNGLSDKALTTAELLFWPLAALVVIPIGIISMAGALGTRIAQWGYDVKHKNRLEENS